MEALLGLTCCAATAAEPAAVAAGSQCACECIGAPQDAEAEQQEDLAGVGWMGPFRPQLR